MRRTCPPLLLLVGSLVLTACDSSPTSPVACTLDATVPPNALQGVSASDVSTALLDAAERSTRAVSDTRQADQLRSALTAVAAAQDDDARCNELGTARAALAAVAGDPGAAPDVSIISILLDIAQSFYAPR
jgi:hypothetical protein